MGSSRGWLAVVLVAALVGAAATAPLGAQQEDAVKLVVELSTEVSPLPFDLPPGFPGMEDLDAPQMILYGQAVYPNRAVEPIWVTVPAALGLESNRLPLRVYQPAPIGEPPPPQEEPVPEPVPTHMSLTTKLYWHCPEAHGPLTETLEMTGQDYAGLQNGMEYSGTAWGEDPAEMIAELARTASGSTEPIAAEVVGAGLYVLNTGGLTAGLDGFLPPIQMLSHTNLSAVDPAEGLLLQWEPVAGARGYLLHAMAMVAQGEHSQEIIVWVSTREQPPERVRSGDYEQETTIADDLEAGILLPGETTQCQVPAGIFPSEVDMFQVNVVAVGNDYYDQTEGVVVRGRLRSTWTAMRLPGLDFDLEMDWQNGGGLQPGEFEIPDWEDLEGLDWEDLEGLELQIPEGMSLEDILQLLPPGYGQG